MIGQLGTKILVEKSKMIVESSSFSGEFADGTQKNGCIILYPGGMNITSVGQNGKIVSRGFLSTYQQVLDKLGISGNRLIDALRYGWAAYRLTLAANAQRANKGELELASKFGQRAAEIYTHHQALPEAARAWFDLGNIHRFRGAREEAIMAYRMALKTPPAMYGGIDRAAAESNLGALLIENGAMSPESLTEAARLLESSSHTYRAFEGETPSHAMRSEISRNDELIARLQRLVASSEREPPRDD